MAQGVQQPEGVHRFDRHWVYLCAPSRDTFVLAALAGELQRYIGHPWPPDAGHTL